MKRYAVKVVLECGGVHTDSYTVWEGNQESGAVIAFNQCAGTDAIDCIAEDEEG